MNKSHKKVNSLLDKQIRAMFFQLIADLKSTKEADLVLSDILTNSEVASFAKRLAIGYWLAKNRSYQNIKQNLKVSSATIAEIQPLLNSQGWKLAIKKITADEWANVWEEKIKKLIKRK